MKLADSQRRTSRPAAEPSPRDKTTPTRGRGALAIPEVVARAFAVANAGLRVRVLSRLINSAGTMALAVVGGGVFFRLSYARAVSLEDAARVTTSQVFELARYVQQSNPPAIVHVMGLLTRDPATMSALGASLAAIAIGYLAERGPKLD